MFAIDNSVPETSLPKNGPYQATITKAEVTTSKVKADGKGGNLMIKLELTIPPTDESMMTQKFTAPIKVYDFIVFPCDASGAHKDAADMCKIKANNFMKAAELVGKENSAVADLVGKTIGIVAKQQSDDYGDKLVVSKYREGTLKAAENIPF